LRSAPGSDSDDGGEARARALALLEATHTFPCAYALAVIAHNREAVITAVRRAVEPPRAEGAPPGPETRLETVASGGGRYISLRFSVWVDQAADVLAIYARLKAVEGVVTAL
jgi:putative lipoic acid-binding regulatory protein